VNPTHYIYAIKKALDIYKPNIPIVYNSGGYDRVETLKKLENYIDIYMLDFKYLSKENALKYSGAYDYPDVAKNAILEAYRQKPFCSFKDGLMISGVIIRHLLLPQNTKEAMAVFDWYYNNVNSAYFSIMSQYVPFGKAKEMPPINRKITNREYDKVVDYISSFTTEKIYIQDIGSGKEKYIPDFNLSGV
jgi:putative pyruvate formate lyase activating enzyme